MIGLGLGLTAARSRNSLTPALLADFATGRYRANFAPTTFDDLFTFSRASTATYVDSSGTLQTASSGEARLNHHVYENGQWVNKGLLLESEARTNLITDSRDLSGFSVNGVTLTPAQETGRDGQLSLCEIVENTASGVHQIFEAIALDPATTYTVSYDVKAGARDVVEIATTGSGMVWSSTKFNLSSGSVTGGNTTGHIQYFGNGIYRISSTFTTVDGGTTTTRLLLSNGSTTAYVGDGSSNAFVGFAQLEEAPTPSSYIPTNGSTITRAAESLTIAATDLPYDSTAMSMAMKGEMTYADDDTQATVAFVGWGVNPESFYVSVYTDGSRDGMLALEVRTDGNYDNSIVDAFDPGTGVPFNWAVRLTDSEAAIAEGGSLSGSLTISRVPLVSSDNLEFGVPPTGSSGFMGTIETFRMWGGVGLTDAQLEEATS